MALSFCAVIPVYNHHKKIAQVVEKIRQEGLFVILIDDGSERFCADVLNTIAETSGVTLVRLEKNSGKGVAVCRGLYEAHKLGFTHALQVDADGQHDLNDIPHFVALSELNPKAVISGARAYSAMPKGRSRGRRLTDFWVAVNSLSLQLKDSMCGYRMYPLAQTLQLLDRRNVGARMDFDTDMLVRLYWQGCDVINLATNIRYANEIPSHFNLVKDNVRIVWMHIKLFGGMLVRSPRLLIRKPYDARIPDNSSITLL